MTHFSAENSGDYTLPAPKPSLFARIKNAIKNLLGINSEPAPAAQTEAYDLVRRPIKYLPIVNDNPLQPEINKALFAAKTNTHPEGVSEADIISVLKYLTPTEMKPGDSLKVADNQSVTYTELVKVAQDVENVSLKDATFKTMPRIFVYPAPPKDSREEAILDKLNIAPDNVAYSYTDSIIISQDFSNKRNREGVFSAFAHEYGHRLNFATQGIVTAEYNPFKHAQMTGNDAARMQQEQPTIKGAIDLKNKELSRQEETIADDYAALAGYGKGIKEFAKDNVLPFSETSKHPSSNTRVANIEHAEANPQSALQKIEKSLDRFKRQIFSRPVASHQELVESQAEATTYQPSR
jgi:hypothetical protein